MSRKRDGMDLLPRTHKEFQNPEYWESFFKKRGGKAFDWYGEYPELCGILGKYVKNKDKILVVGCGNSKLSEQMYDVGYMHQDNIDISDTVIKQMTQKNKARTGMKFTKMDVTQMSYEDGSFSVVLDKGTLDALLVDTNDEVMGTVEAMFGEVDRVLSLGGRYIIISLLQDVVLHPLLQHFTQLGWCIRVHPVPMASREDSEFGLPVFAVVLTKFKKMPGMGLIVEVSGASDKMERLADTEALKEIVKEMQYYAIIRQRISRKKNVDDIPPVCLYTKVTEAPRYTLYIVDSPKPCSNKFAVFITPQGGESEWLFCTGEGRRTLAQQVAYERLVVVVLDRSHSYTSLQEVQAELDGKIMDLAPPNFPEGTKVPYLSRGGDLGSREEVGQGHSDLSGDYVVEDVENDEQCFRRLLFMRHPTLVQSEARLKTVLGKKGKKVRVVDKNYLACEFHIAMTAGLVAIRDFASTMDKGASLLLLGLGGGCLPVFLQQHFPKLDMEVVDIDEAVVDLAQKYFAFQPGPQLKVHVADGLDFVVQKQKEGAKYDVVMFDVDSKDLSQGLSCPPAAFLEPAFLHSTASLVQDGGVFVLNLVCRDEALKKELLARLESVFKTVATLRIEEDVNEVCFACQEDHDSASLPALISKAVSAVTRKVERKSKKNEDLCEAFAKLQLSKSS